MIYKKKIISKLKIKLPGRPWFRPNDQLQKTRYPLGSLGGCETIQKIWLGGETSFTVLKTHPWSSRGSNTWLGKLNRNQYCLRLQPHRTWGKPYINSKQDNRSETNQIKLITWYSINLKTKPKIVQETQTHK